MIVRRERNVRTTEYLEMEEARHKEYVSCGFCKHENNKHKELIVIPLCSNTLEQNKQVSCLTKVVVKISSALMVPLAILSSHGNSSHSFN